MFPCLCLEDSTTSKQVAFDFLLFSRCCGSGSGEWGIGLMIHSVGKLLTFPIYFSDKLYFLCLSTAGRADVQENPGRIHFSDYSFPTYLTYKMPNLEKKINKLLVTCSGVVGRCFLGFYRNAFSRDDHRLALWLAEWCPPQACTQWNTERPLSLPSTASRILHRIWKDSLICLIPEILPKANEGDSQPAGKLVRTEKCCQ